MIKVDIEQGTDEWKSLRCGLPSASKFSEIITTSGDRSKSVTKYIYTLAGESISGQRQEIFQSQAMLRGVELEPEARAMYEFMKDVDVEQVGFCFMNEDRKFGCSPDGLVGDDGMLEIKVPLVHTHIDYLFKGKMPTTYFQQVQGQMYVCDRKWCDFMSYSPSLKPFLIRVYRDDDFIEKLAVELEYMCSQIEEVIKKIK